MELVTTIAVLTAVVAVILDKTLPLIAKSRNGGDPLKKICTELTLIRRDLEQEKADRAQMKRWVGELHRWHDKEDPDGVKVWYVRQSLEDAITKLAEAANAQTRLLEQILDNQERQS